MKYNDDRSIERLNAHHLVANGKRQIQGCDYEDTFSPVVHPLSIRLILTLAVSKDWRIHQIDVSNVFLHGHLEEWITVCQPFGFEDPSNPDYVCLLNKVLYGLKQSPRCWFKRLREALVTMEFHESKIDPSVFISKVGEVQCFMCICRRYNCSRVQQWRNPKSNFMPSRTFSD